MLGNRGLSFLMVTFQENAFRSLRNTHLSYSTGFGWSTVLRVCAVFKPQNSNTLNLMGPGNLIPIRKGQLCVSLLLFSEPFL